MQNKTKDQVYAGFFVRLAAYCIDWFIVGIGLLAVRVPIWISNFASPDNLLVRDFIFEYSVADIVIYILMVTYFILPTYYTGRTLGKRLLQLKVISTEDRSMTFFEVIYRETVGKFLSGLLLGIGYLMICIEKEKRGIHDLLADTKVIYYHEKKEPVQTPIVYQPVERTVIYPENQKSYYQNAMMNGQNMPNRQVEPMKDLQNIQNHPGQPMPESQNRQEMSEFSMSHVQNHLEEPEMSSQEEPSHSEDSMINPQDSFSQDSEM